jgi:hypothetical protein
VLTAKEERSLKVHEPLTLKNVKPGARAIVPEPHVLSPFLKIAQPGGASLGGYQNEPTPDGKNASSELDTKTKRFILKST